MISPNLPPPMEPGNTNHPTSRRENQPLRAVFWTVFTATVGWTIWVILMKIAPDPFANEVLRALVRVSVVLIPALAFNQVVDDQSLRRLIHFDLHVLKITLIGLGLTFGYVILLMISTGTDFTVHLPTTFAAWFNGIIGSPLAEEFLYRGVVFTQLRHLYGLPKAAVVSTILFAMLHLPVWILIDHQSLMSLIASFTSICMYGGVFTLLLHWAGSLWAPFASHSLNNFLFSIISR
jgi:uncharacterized protein